MRFKTFSEGIVALGQQFPEDLLVGVAVSGDRPERLPPDEAGNPWALGDIQYINHPVPPGFTLRHEQIRPVGVCVPEPAAYGRVDTGGIDEHERPDEMGKLARHESPRSCRPSIFRSRSAAGPIEPVSSRRNDAVTERYHRGVAGSSVPRGWRPNPGRSGDATSRATPSVGMNGNHVLPSFPNP